MLFNPYLLINWMLCVANDEYIFQAAMNDIKVILSCLEYYRLDLMLILSYIYIKIFHRIWK